ncbi:unnamed protein product [Ceratitis capitata]|uniref:(Mediterranean fruit fly) hypothetical protein n=1 Tax=Ceratitis capitata TaxID=7213 RepID=A0A811UK68_CERCA|nr:unnamed protein product [Ceratitis capitata]
MRLGVSLSLSFTQCHIRNVRVPFRVDSFEALTRKPTYQQMLLNTHKPHIFIAMDICGYFIICGRVSSSFHLIYLGTHKYTSSSVYFSSLFDISCAYIFKLYMILHLPDKREKLKANSSTPQNILNNFLKSTR